MRAQITYAGLSIALLLSLVGTTPLASATPQVPGPGHLPTPPRVWAPSPLGLVQSFDPSNYNAEICGTAVPVTGLIDGQGASWAQLYYDPLSGGVYASWSLETHTMNNGADKFVFGFVITDANGNEWADGVVFPYQAGVCIFLTSWWDIQFHYIIEAGAVGWFGQTACNVSFHWEAGVGVSVDVTGPQVEASFSLGGSVSCGRTQTIDSETLIFAFGKAGLCPECFIPPGQG